MLLLTLKSRLDFWLAVLYWLLVHCWYRVSGWAGGARNLWPKQLLTPDLQKMSNWIGNPARPPDVTPCQVEILQRGAPRETLHQKNFAKSSPLYPSRHWMHALLSGKYCTVNGKRGAQTDLSVEIYFPKISSKSLYRNLSLLNYSIFFGLGQLFSLPCFNHIHVKCFGYLLR